MTPHPTDTSEITRPLDLVAQEPLHPREAFRLRIISERNGIVGLHHSTDSAIKRTELFEYIEMLDDILRHIAHWKAWHKENDHG